MNIYFIDFLGRPGERLFRQYLVTRSRIFPDLQGGLLDFCFFEVTEEADELPDFLGRPGDFRFRQ